MGIRTKMKSAVQSMSPVNQARLQKGVCHGLALYVQAWGLCIRGVGQLTHSQGLKAMSVASSETAIYYRALAACPPEQLAKTYIHYMEELVPCLEVAEEGFNKDMHALRNLRR